MIYESKLVGWFGALRQRAPQALGGSVLLIFSAIAGGVCAVFPVEFVIRFALIIAVLLIVAAALLSARIRVAGEAGEAWIRVTMLFWLFLLGVCPAYLPFKFGPLPGLNPLRVSFLMMSALWGYQIIASSGLRQRLAGRIAAAPRLFGLFACYFAWQLLSLLLADEPMFVFPGWIQGLGPALAALIVLSVVRDWRDMLHVVYALCAGALVTCAVGVLEWRLGRNPFQAFFPTDPDQLEALAWITADKYRSGVYRVAGTFSHPLALGEFLGMCLPFSGAAALVTRSRWIRALAILLACASLLVIYLTNTRSALLASAVSVMMYGALVAVRAARNKESLGLALLGWMSILVALIVSVGVIAGSARALASGRDAAERGSSLARVEMLRRGADAVSERPLQGFGPGMAAIKAGVYSGGVHLTIDSHYLSVVVEYGLVGLSLYIAALVLVMLSAVRGSLTGGDPAKWIMPAIAVALISSLIVKTILSLTNNFNLFYVLIALAVIGAQNAAADRATPARSEGSAA